MWNRFLETLKQLHAEDDALIEEHARFLEARLVAGAARVRRGVASLDGRARIGIASMVAGLAATLAAVNLPAIDAIGSGYFLRFGILLVGLGAHLLLRR